MCPFCIATGTLTGISVISGTGVAAVFIRLIAKDEKGRASQILNQGRLDDGDSGDDSSAGCLEQ